MFYCLVCQFDLKIKISILIICKNCKKNNKINLTNFL